MGVQGAEATGGELQVLDEVQEGLGMGVDRGRSHRASGHCEDFGFDSDCSRGIPSGFRAKLTCVD